MRTSIRIGSIAVPPVVAAVMLLARFSSPHGAPGTPGAGVVHAPQPEALTVAAGPGRVEPVSEEIRIGFEISGQLRSVEVEEGERIRRGQLLAVLVNDELRARVMGARATLLAKEATLRKVVNGARTQERREAVAAERKAQAVLDNARFELDRGRQLFASKLISRQDLDRFSRQHDVARAEHEQAVERESLLYAAAREEDRALAEAEVELARAQLSEANALHAKSFLRSPIDGTVLRRLHHGGESVSSSPIGSDPVVTVGDTSVLRVRVDIDEADVMRVHVGQRAWVTAQAFGRSKFPGHVIRIGERLGPKNVRTEEPAERIDTKVLETLVELDPGVALPIGLRVDAFFAGDSVP